MINIIVAYDNVDTQLGTYFENCKIRLLSTLGKMNNPVIYNICEIPNYNCNNSYIDSLLIKNIPNPFIFIAYSHGDKQALYCGKNKYVEKNINTNMFINSLFYTTACSAGKELGDDLIDKGCSVFIGYKKEKFIFPEKVKREISTLCDNAGITEFLSNDITIFEAFKKMEDIYTQQIDNLNNADDMVFAAHLVDAREALVFLGKHNLKKGDFFIN
jgi:hypothetical protein